MMMIFLRLGSDAGNKLRTILSVFYLIKRFFVEAQSQIRGVTAIPNILQVIFAFLADFSA